MEEDGERVRGKRGLFALILLITFLIFFAWAFQRPYVPLFAKEHLGASAPQVGWIMGLAGIITAIMAIPSGLASDRFGRRVMLTLGALGMGIGSLGLALTSNLLQLTLFFIAIAAAMAIFDPSIGAIVGDIAGRGRLGRAYGYFTMVLQSAVAVGPALGGILISTWGYSNSFLSIACLALSASLLVYLALPSWSRSSGNNLSWPKTLPFRGVTTAWATILFSTTLQGALVTFLPLYLLVLGHDALMAGLLISVQAVASSLMRMPLGALVDKLGGEVMLIAIMLGLNTFALALLSLVPQLPYFFLAMILTGVGRAMMGLGSQVLVAKYTTKEERGTAMGVSSTFRFMGFSLGPTFLATLLSWEGESPLGYSISFLWLSALGALGIMVILATWQFLGPKEEPPN